MRQRGFTHNDKPSIRSLARSAGVTVNAVSRVIFRENFGEDTVVRVGEALGDETFVAEWVSVDLGSEYTPPVAARKLTSRQRLLVDDLIRELTGGQKDAGDAEAEKSSGEAVTPNIDPDDWRLAARRGESVGRRLREQLDGAGEESQDDGGVEW